MTLVTHQWFSMVTSSSGWITRLAVTAGSGGAIGVQRVEDQDATKHLAKLRAAPIIKNDPAACVNRAELEKLPWLQAMESD